MNSIHFEKFNLLPHLQIFLKVYPCHFDAKKVTPHTGGQAKALSLGIYLRWKLYN